MNFGLKQISDPRHFPNVVARLAIFDFLVDMRHIVDFVMVKENDVYHNRFRLYDEKTGARFPDSIEVNVLELPKVHEADGKIGRAHV